MMRPESVLLLFVLVFSPLAFGTVEPWSRAIAEGAALAGLAIALHRRTHGQRLQLHAVPGMPPLLLFLGFLLLQCVPLPPALLYLLSPAAHARWDAALGSAGPLPWLTISLDPLATLREFIRFLAQAAFYVLTVQLLARRERLRAVTTALAIFSASLAFEAILQAFIAPGRLLFMRTSPSPVSFGPFVNRNHYGNLMAMLTPVVFALFLVRGRPGGARTLRERLVDLLARRESNIRLLLGFAALLSAGSIVVSLSRGATLAAIAALFVFGGCLVAHRPGLRRTLAAALFLGALTLFVGWFGWEKVADRFSSLRANPDIVDSVRAGLWRDTLRIAADFPLFGAGVGSFERLYPAYRSVPGSIGIVHAHNDYLELLAGAGVVGLGTLAWFVASVMLCVVRACARRQDRFALFVALGSFAGCVAFLVHGASDFSLAIGANALHFFFLLGLAVSAAHSGAQTGGQRTLLAARSLPAHISRAVAALALAAVLAHGADFAARQTWRQAAELLPRPETGRVPAADAKELVALASRLQPLEAAYPAAGASLAARDGNLDEALRLARRALRLLPIDAGALMQLGTLHGARGEAAAALRSFTAALAADPAAAGHRETVGAWLLSRGDRVGATAQLREAMLREPARAPRVFSLLVLAGLEDEQIAAVVPPDPTALLSFARYATATGKPRLAAEAFRRVLVLDPGNQQAAAGLRSGEPTR